MGETRMNTRHRQIVASQTPIPQHDICLRKCLVKLEIKARSHPRPRPRPRPSMVIIVPLLF